MLSASEAYKQTKDRINGGAKAIVSVIIEPAIRETIAIGDYQVTVKTSYEETDLTGERILEMLREAGYKATYTGDRVTVSWAEVPSKES